MFNEYFKTNTELEPKLLWSTEPITKALAPPLPTPGVVGVVRQGIGAR